MPVRLKVGRADGVEGPAREDHLACLGALCLRSSLGRVSVGRFARFEGPDWTLSVVGLCGLGSLLVTPLLMLERGRREADSNLAGGTPCRSRAGDADAFTRIGSTGSRHDVGAPLSEESYSEDSFLIRCLRGLKAWSAADGSSLSDVAVVSCECAGATDRRVFSASALACSFLASLASLRILYFTA